MEYKNSVPKVLPETLGKFSRNSDSGHFPLFFVENHALWWMRYFEKKNLGIPVFPRTSANFKFIRVHWSQDPKVEKSFLFGHGDGLGPNGQGVINVWKRYFGTSLSKMAFSIGYNPWFRRFRLGQYLSVKNKLISGDEDCFKFFRRQKRMARTICQNESCRN